jgi:hypothetical protein
MTDKFYAWIVKFIVPLSIALYAPLADAQDVCGQLGQSLQTLRKNGGVGSQWEAMTLRQLQDYGCLGTSPQTYAQNSPSFDHCRAQGVEKKLAGAALESFMRACEVNRQLRQQGMTLSPAPTQNYAPSSGGMFGLTERGPDGKNYLDRTVCAQLLEAYQVQRNNPGVSPEWEAFTIRQLNENRCLR